MKWQKETPIEYGYYWFKGTIKYDTSPVSTPVFVPDMVLVDEPFGNPCTMREAPLTAFQGEWFGPMEPPSE